MKKNGNQKLAIFSAILAAAFYAFNAPISKILLVEIQPTMMAALLYLGAGLGMFGVNSAQKFIKHKSSELPLSKLDLPYVIWMILLDIIAPILLMLGLSLTSSANASLLNNFEIVSTSIFAMIFFKEKISVRLWFGIILVSISSMILSVSDWSRISFSLGSVFILLACISWGLENNCTRVLSNKDPMQIVMVKGFGSGLGSLLIAFTIGENLPQSKYLMLALVLGFAAYGLSVFFYVYAQRDLGAARTSTYYAVSPFLGVIFSLLIFSEIPSSTFVIALVLMILGAYFTSYD